MSTTEGRSASTENGTPMLGGMRHLGRRSSALENRCTGPYRGFESHLSVRSPCCTTDCRGLPSCATLCATLVPVGGYLPKPFAAFTSAAPSFSVVSRQGMGWQRVSGA